MAALAVPARHTAIAAFAANTDLGKTVLSAAVCRAAASLLAAPSSVAYIKPVQTGYPNDSDSRFVSKFCPGVRARTLFTFSDPVSPHMAAAQENRILSDETVVASIRSCMIANSTAIGHERDAFTLIETAGGVNSPTASGTLQSTLFQSLSLPALLVGDSDLGGISTTLSAYESLRMVRNIHVPLVLLFLDERYRNHEVIARYVDARVVVVPPPPPRAARPEEDSENLTRWYAACADGLLLGPVKEWMGK
ncbi:AAA domain-containing protein [Chytriomyces sp. MP71]|nr:AAA domain-containing protein [Chytriomyces sp. MP71]